MDYQVFQPGHELSSFVKCYWTLESDSPSKQTIVPDGCMEMIFYYGDLYLQTHINRRQLERKFSVAIGLSPKQLSKTIRLQAALQLLLSKKNIRLTTLAHEGEYYDQAHFIKDFREFTGLTPKEFYGDRFKISRLFI